MDEDIIKSNKAKVSIRTDIEQDQINSSKIIVKKAEILLCKPLSPEDSTQGPDDKKNLSNSIKVEFKDDELMDDNTNDLGGHLTFFKDGKPLLELSHKTEQGSWVQVKSKTYWPPATIAKTTTQLKNGSSLWSTDECSNNSSAFTYHLRKQTSPQRVLTQTSAFYFHAVRVSDCPRLKPRRTPFLVLNYNNCDKDITYRKRTRFSLQEMVLSICEKIGSNIERSLTISALSDIWRVTNIEIVGQSPRKRMMKYINGEKEGNSRKKPHSCVVPASHKQSDRAAGTSVQNNSKPMSSYSIDSLLNNDSSSRNESFLRNLLKSDVKESQSNVRNSSSHESAKNSKHKNWFDSNNGSDGRSSKNVPPEYNNLRKMPALNNFLMPYLNSNYLPMPPFYPGTQPTPEMASMVAAAINLQGLQNSSLLPPSASLEAGYRAASLHSPQPRVFSRSSHSPQQRTRSRASPSSPQPRIFNHGSQSPQPRATNHTSPNSPQPPRTSSLTSPQPRASSLISYHPTISYSPNSKHNFNSHLASMSPYISSLSSPPSPWVPSTSNSPNVTSSALSPPPQDVPLNLSKRKEKG